jgi:hypothetical protein
MKQEPRKKKYGIFLTPIEIFEKYIYDNIKDKINDYVFVDFFCGSGNLILPILNHIPRENRNEYFKNHIFLFDILDNQVETAIKNAINLGIDESIARENIKQRDTIKNYPKELVDKFGDKLFHITNPPYGNVHFIGRSFYKENMQYFTGRYQKFQDLYQLALINDFDNNIKNLIYLIPTNFINGDASSNKIRSEFFTKYTIQKAISFERQIFEETGITISIFFFEKIEKQLDEIRFINKKIGYTYSKDIETALIKKYNYRNGWQALEWIKNNTKADKLNASFKLKIKEVEQNKGSIKALFYIPNSKEYKEYLINQSLYDKIKSNPLYIRIVDGGSKEKKIGLYSIEDLKCDGIISADLHRISAMQVFFKEKLTKEQIKKVISLFNQRLNYLRDLTDSDFLLTFQTPYGNEYIKKYLSIKQAKEILKTISLKELE